MCKDIKLLNGAFTATFEKGNKDKIGKWKFTPNLSKLGKKKINKGSLIEKPQFEVINEIEQSAVKDFKQSTKQTVLETALYLKKLIA